MDVMRASIERNTTQSKRNTEETRSKQQSAGVKKRLVENEDDKQTANKSHKTNESKGGQCERGERHSCGPMMNYETFIPLEVFEVEPPHPHLPNVWKCSKT